MRRLRGSLFRTCPKTHRIVGICEPKDLPRVLFPLVGLLALIWFLIRVAPKPGRAAYPCQRVAAPLAGSFLVWMAGIAGASLAFRQARTRMRQARYCSAGLAVIVALAGLSWAALSKEQAVQAVQAVPVAYTPHPANSPIGVAKGLKPGRVAWIHDPQATTWDGTTTSVGQRWYDLVSQPEATTMMRQALTGYADTTTASAAWDAIFRHFNGGAGYQPGEKVFIKINLVTSNAPDCADANYNWILGPGAPPTCRDVTWVSISPSPQLMVALLDQLVNVVGMQQSDITIGDPTGLWVNELYDKVQPNFPTVKYLDARGTLGRTKAARSTVPLYWSAPAGETNNTNQDYLIQAAVDAKYIINLAVLKSHSASGITATAKNHYGSLSGGNDTDDRKPATAGYYDLHRRLPLVDDSLGGWPLRADLAQYRPMVDLNGHAGMGGKTLLYMIDGIYAGRDFCGTPSKWAVLPFCTDPTCGDSATAWPASLFLSMDQVAIDSVAFDFLSLRAADWPEVLAAEGVQDYLHEMALANNPPSGAFYDPELDGVAMASQGVHEHWNNTTDKKYTRNLGTGDGIELLYMPKTTDVRKTEQPIVVDGNIDPAWSHAAAENLNNVVLGTVSNTSDLSASYRALYDETNLYFMVEVTDNTVMSSASPNWYDDDGVEIMIDGDYSRGVAYDSGNDFDLGFRWNDPAITRGANSAPIPPSAEFKMVRTNNGYRLEVKLPITQLGIAPAYGRLFGLDVNVNDDDDGGGRDAKMAWAAQVDDSWLYPYRLGAGRLAGPQNVSVEASPQGSQVHFGWTNYSWDALYEVHRSASPYFMPEDTTIVKVATSSESEYLDTPPDSSASWYYLVRAKESGLGANSNRTGKFVYSLFVP